MKHKPDKIDSSHSDRIDLLARKIFIAFSEDCTCLKFYPLSCGCIFYRRVFPNGELDEYLGIYRDRNYGPCEECSRFPKEWEDRVIEEVTVYSTQFQYVSE